MLEITLALDGADLVWAKSMIEEHHYLRSVAPLPVPAAYLHCQVC